MAHRRATPSTSSTPCSASQLAGAASGRGRAAVVLDDVVVRGEQEAAGAAGRVADRLAGLRAACTSTMAWMSGRGVKYWPAPPLVSCGVLLQQPLVGVALHVGVERDPLLAVDQVDDQPPQLGRVLDLVLRLAEDDARACPAACRALRACGGSGPPASSPSRCEQARPVVARRGSATAGCTAAASARGPS